MAEQGATVTAFDLNAEFVRRTQARTNKRVKVLQADLAEPLAFAADLIEETWDVNPVQF